MPHYNVLFLCTGNSARSIMAEAIMNRKGGDFPNYSICGLLFYLSGETPDWHSLAHRTEFDGIAIRRKHKALRIDSLSKNVEVRSEEGCSFLPYDKLLIGTGASPATPPIEGWQSPGVFLLLSRGTQFGSCALSVQRLRARKA